MHELYFLRAFWNELNNTLTTLSRFIFLRRQSFTSPGKSTDIMFGFRDRKSEMLTKTEHEIGYRLDVVRATNGAHIEVYAWKRHVARIGEFRNAYIVLVGKQEGKRPLGRPRCRWEDNIKMDLREVGYDDRDWINLAQDRDQWRAYVRAAMNLRVSREAIRRGGIVVANSDKKIKLIAKYGGDRSDSVTKYDGDKSDLMTKYDDDKDETEDSPQITLHSPYGWEKHRRKANQVISPSGNRTHARAHLRIVMQAPQSTELRRWLPSNDITPIHLLLQELELLAYSPLTQQGPYSPRRDPIVKFGQYLSAICGTRTTQVK
ncbi:hypothetical protein ANN_04490 [Periplaneta americana]|uniref:Uncharacterized protein n=1 Tax=Periplaneta americana TaxID=6978 RepID=A0ABQ8TAI5_PERAM|nr:hypothetical protein ANN_04490 [Periplaneta americana]